MHVQPKNASKFLRRRPSHQQTPSDTPNDAPASPASTTEAPSFPTRTPSLLSPLSRRTESEEQRNSPTPQEESDTGANSSESEYLLSDPTGYRSNEFSPDKKVQFTDGKKTKEDQFDENGSPVDVHKDKKKKK